jgi:hypothetical protein
MAKQVEYAASETASYIRSKWAHTKGFGVPFRREGVASNPATIAECHVWEVHVEDQRDKEWQRWMKIDAMIILRWRPKSLQKLL